MQKQQSYGFGLAATQTMQHLSMVKAASVPVQIQSTGEQPLFDLNEPTAQDVEEQKVQASQLTEISASPPRKNVGHSKFF